MSAVVERLPSETAVIRVELEKMQPQFAAALPAHIPVERFARVVMTAIQQNPELLECDRRSFWNAAMRAAQDGLLPDGREGAMVVRKDKKVRAGKSVSWQPMIAGIRKKVRNSGEIATWDAHVVHERDQFEFALGDDPYIRHKPHLGEDRGAIVAAYSVAVLKGGEKSREVMSIAEIRRIRDRSDAWRAFKAGYIKSTPWSTDEAEMCRKTVARRHSKVLPMSTDLDDLIRRDDELYDMQGAREEAKQIAGGRPQSLAGRLDALAGLTVAKREPENEESDQTEESPGIGPGDEGESPSAERQAATTATADAARAGEAADDGAASPAASEPEISDSDREHWRGIGHRAHEREDLFGSRAALGQEPAHD